MAGPWLAEKLARFGLDNAVAVPFGIDKSRFSPSLAEPALRRRWLAECGVPDTAEATLWVAISRHHPEKRLFTLLNAFAIASKARPMGLVIFGDGPLRSLVVRRAKTIPGVHVAGFTEDRTLLARSLASADAFLHGSSAETYGLVVAEAICSGLPLVVPDQGGAADLADDGFAELYPAGDALACADAMVRLAARPAALLKQAALETAQRRVGTMADHFEKLFALYGR